MLSLTECVWDFQKSALWDTHEHAVSLKVDCRPHHHTFHSIVRSHGQTFLHFEMRAICWESERTSYFYAFSTFKMGVT